ncbi:MAG TPA: DNA mismatch repair protein MutS [Candidatus Krumholzibacteria bacterium]|nr:DNA mismatch repair protein MutS [Candidatus Krumholzibacteria bacterium]
MSPKARGNVTPMMAQYLGLKEQHPDAVLLFRMGDFYETFFDDAELVAGLLGLTLTAREKQGDDPIPLAGVPHHALEHHLTRLLEHGLTVAICEQTEDPKKARGLVKREVVEVISPGTVTNPALIRGADAVFLLAVEPRRHGDWGWALLDGSTGEFRCGSSPPEDVSALLRRYEVAEVVAPDPLPPGTEVERTLGATTVTTYARLHYDPSIASEALCDHFAVAAVDGLGLDPDEPAVGAAGAALRYLADRQRARPTQVRRVHVDRGEGRLHLDRETVAHLELFESMRGADRASSLFHHVDRTCTPLGRRRLAAWMRAPLCDVQGICARHDAIDALLAEAGRLDGLRETLRGIGDLERIVGRIATHRALPHELAALRAGLQRWPSLVERTRDCDTPLLGDVERHADACTELAERLAAALVDEPPTHLRHGRVFREGHDEELDRLRALNRDGKTWIAGYQESERQRTGIANLKVGFNKVFGYHVEVTNKHLDKVPDDYVEKQRLTSGKRFVTEALKEREQEILRAEELQVEREATLFSDLVAELAEDLGPVHDALDALATLDALVALATIAREQDYRRPRVEPDLQLDVEDGRHPVVERLSDESFVPNDVRLDPAQRQIVLLTGPNMGGKSTYLRQTALIVILAQMGSFVPARRARIGLVDRVHTRVGASDDLARGQSTFLVEMTETARILRGATARSLVIFDEVGRGTSTRDGLALARAIVEFLHEGPVHPRTLFATHFHELTAVAERLPRAVNAQLEVREYEGRILFLHRVVPGAADRSYGIHVAELAGVPAPVLERARELLDRAQALESDAEDAPAPPPPRFQLPLFESAPPAPHPVVERLKELDTDTLRPVDALVVLAELAEEARNGRSG